MPREAGSEEYLDSEKYQNRAWDFDRARESGRRDRRGESHSPSRIPALQYTTGLVFHPTDNEQLLCYSKSTADGCNRVLVVVNLNFYAAEQGFVDLNLEDLGLSGDRPYQLHDLLNDATFHWEGGRNFVKLDPGVWPAHVFRIAQA